MRVSSRSLTSSSYSTPSNSQSIRSRWSSGCSPRSASIAAEPAPETDWYVATRTRRSPAASRSGASTIVSGIAQQLGFATMPVCSSARSPLTSGTTSGMPGCRRNADDLSMHRAPAAAAVGTSSRLSCVPIEKKQTSRSPAPSASPVASSISISPSEPPAERLDANARMFVYPRSRRYWSVTRPTAPVAPTIPIRSPDSIIAPV